MWQKGQGREAAGEWQGGRFMNPKQLDSGNLLLSIIVVKDTEVWDILCYVPDLSAVGFPQCLIPGVGRVQACGIY